MAAAGPGARVLSILLTSLPVLLREPSVLPVVSVVSGGGVLKGVQTNEYILRLRFAALHAVARGTPRSRRHVFMTRCEVSQ